MLDLFNFHCGSVHWQFTKKLDLYVLYICLMIYILCSLDHVAESKSCAIVKVEGEADEEPGMIESSPSPALSDVSISR